MNNTNKRFEMPPATTLKFKGRAASTFDCVTATRSVSPGPYRPALGRFSPYVYLALTQVGHASIGGFMTLAAVLEDFAPWPEKTLSTKLLLYNYVWQ